MGIGLEPVVAPELRGCLGGALERVQRDHRAEGVMDGRDIDHRGGDGCGEVGAVVHDRVGPPGGGYAQQLGQLRRRVDEGEVPLKASGRRSSGGSSSVARRTPARSSASSSRERPAGASNASAATPWVPVDGGGEGDVVPRGRQRPRERQQRAEVPPEGMQLNSARAVSSSRIAPRSLSLSFLK